MLLCIPRLVWWSLETGISGEGILVSCVGIRYLWKVSGVSVRGSKKLLESSWGEVLLEVPFRVNLNSSLHMEREYRSTYCG